MNNCYCNIVLLLVFAVAPAPVALAFNVFPYLSGEGETIYQKWGDPNASTPGGVIEWSIIPDGTGVLPTYPDANLTGTSQMESIMNGLGYNEAFAAIERALDQWSSVANIDFVHVTDSGLPLDDPAANPPASGRIRIGAYPIDAGIGAEAWAPWPFAGTYEGDVLFNANNTFYFSPGNEGDLIPIFNDFESLMLHELGHAIGLAHSDVCSVMSVDFECFKFINRQLDPDDIAGAQFLYGPAIQAADFDEDGDVDGSDLAKWETGYGMASGAAHMDGDADEDLDVDGLDFLIWQRQFTGDLSLPASTAVPEPSSAILLMGLAAMRVLFGSRLA